MPFNIITASKVTASNAVMPLEIYIPLWWYSGSTASTTATTSYSALLQRGSTAMGTPLSQGIRLHTLNSSWPASTKFAFEATIYNGSAGNTTYAALWDFTAGAIVSGSQISIASTTAMVVRSGPFSLTPGHVYGVTVWCNAGTAYITDASLIAYPPGITNKSTFFDALRTSFTRTPGMPTEMYIPLWTYSNNVASTASTTAGSSLLQKGSTSMGAPSTTAAKLHTLNSSWPATQKFAFEASISNGGVSNTTYAALWDITAGSIVSGSQVSITNSTIVVLVRSGSFTLTPGHTYGVTVWCTAGTAYIAKAHLVPLLS